MIMMVVDVVMIVLENLTASVVVKTAQPVKYSRKRN